jgi:iron(III) transport system ATP-binding protein
MKQSLILQLNQIVKKFPASETRAIDHVNLSLNSGELMGLLGPSGCGKTTLLRIIAGFEEISQGTVVIDEAIVSSSRTCLPPERRNTGMVFQDYALFPHLTVGANVAFGLKNLAKSSKDSRHRVGEVLELVGLTGLEKRYPHQLSGGQQQRIALARALAPQPSLILLDEPLSNLDVQVRQRLREEIRSILKAAGTSAIFVTHDREEALAISDRIAVMRGGRIEQLGTPETIYIQPASRFVAEFVTQANFLPARRQGKLWQTEIGTLEIVNSEMADDCDRGDLMIRQEELVLIPDDNSDVVVTERQFLGREYRYCLTTAAGKKIHARTTIANSLAVGTKVKLTLPSRTARIFPDRSCSESDSEAIEIYA